MRIPICCDCRETEYKIALSTGGYCQARQYLPKLLVSRSMEELVARLRSRLLESKSTGRPRVHQAPTGGGDS